MTMVEIHPGIRIEVPEAPWSDRERVAWYWQEPLKPSEWGERYITVDKSAIPGPLSFDHAPYLRGIIDIAVKRGVARLTIKKGVQMGVSLAMRVLMGYWAHMEPAPMGLALPNKEKGRQIVGNEVIPLFRENFRRHPELANLFTGHAHDIKKGEIKLANTFLLYLMWAGSPTSLSADPMKRAICDETDKFDPWSGNDADPISLVQKRLRTYPDSTLILVSSPTDELGYISANFNEATVRLYFLIECPHCKARQRLLFGEGGDYGVKWTDEVRKLFKAGRREEVAMTLLSSPANWWYQCAACHGKITERQKRLLVRQAKWGTIEHDGEGRPQILADGRITDAEALPEFPPESRIGMHISALYCMWESCTLGHVAAEFLRASTMQKLFDFRTGTLAEHWEQQTRGISSETIKALAAGGAKHGLLPRWTGSVIAAIDTQKDHFYIVIRAFGPGMRSRRIWHGRVSSFEELEKWCRHTPWPNEDPRLGARLVDLAFIDSGGTRRLDEEAQMSEAPLPSRVMDVYAWALKHLSWVRAIKGDAHPNPGTFIRRGRGEYVSARGNKVQLPIWLLDSHHFQDELAEMMEVMLDVIDLKTGEVAGKVRKWELNDQPPPPDSPDPYPQHIANMHRTSVGKGSDMRWVWRPIREGVRVDFRMCEVYAVAGAYLAGVHTLPDLPVFLESIEAQLTARANREPGKRFETPGGQSFLATQR